MKKYILALFAALAIVSTAHATTGTTSAATVNVFRAGQSAILFTLTGVSSAGTCATAALDGTNTLVVWAIPTIAGSSATSATQEEALSLYESQAGNVKASQLLGSSIAVNWNDAILSGSYCVPIYIQ